MSTYEILQRFVASFGLIYFGLIFLIGVVYALLPSKGRAYEEASRIPLHED
jgi:cytochrome c oxidase cbb3-type subunit 4